MHSSKKGGDALLTARFDDDEPADSRLEADLLRLIRAMGLPKPKLHYRFALPRQVHLDFYWSSLRPPLALEANGHPSHRGSRYDRDCEKLSLAAAKGIRVLVVTPALLKRKGLVYGLLKLAFSTSGVKLPDIPPRALTETVTATVTATDKETATANNRKDKEPEMSIPLDDYLSSGKSLNAAKIKELGLHNCTFAIKDVREVEFEETDDRQASKKVVLDFEEVEESLPLNKTNLKFLIEKFGSNTDLWIGTHINLIVMPVSFQGKNVDAVRIIEAPKKAEQRKPAAAQVAKAKDPLDATDPFAEDEA